MVINKFYLEFYLFFKQGRILIILNLKDK